MNAPEIAERAVVATVDEPSMRLLEYAIGAFAGIAAFLLGLIH